MVDKRPIGMLDSGVGGLSILREVHRHLPNEDVIYFADQGHVPYGPRPYAEIQGFTRAITRFFLDRQAKAIVVACNAASAASLHHLRETFPEVPFVGMEPAVKPAALSTRSGTIGVITTRATHQGKLFASVVDRFARDVEVVTQVCPRFVTLVEQGDLDSEKAYRIADDYLQPLKEAGVDQLVLGCTHFPFLKPALQEVMGADVTIVDPSGAIARQTGRVIVRNAAAHPGRTTYITSGDLTAFSSLVEKLLQHPVPSADISAVRWPELRTLYSSKGVYKSSS